MSQPAWVAEARPKCPTEAAALDAAEQLLNAIPKDAPVNDFVDAYEYMLEVRTRLYDAWLTLELEA
jgi:hypothetical protein